MTTDTTARVSGTIKALQWSDDGVAEAFGLRYLLNDPNQCDESNGWYILEETTNSVIEGDGSEAAAKASAQADYNARILAAIQPDPEPVAVAWVQRHRLGPLHLSSPDAFVTDDWSEPFPLYATPSSSGMVSVEAHRNEAYEEIRDSNGGEISGDDLREIAMRALAGKKENSND